ncbi:50S ribosomal protein L18Ae [Halomarina halobia]|uniref:Large ribosomal subunit protein eL20 n=1 Tax=Halomarina halobia TaxID=3033386 RepID=A0ABD6A9A4_9EURY|nr:50S ribosomal protein L18Ae [Halomarina sp. PSR21]
MSQYTVTGRFQNRDGLREFSKTVDAPNGDVAVERTYAEFGSKHGLKRTQLEIEGVDR